MTDVDQLDIPQADKDALLIRLQNGLNDLNNMNYEDAILRLTRFITLVTNNEEITDEEREHFISWSEAVIAVINQLIP